MTPARRLQKKCKNNVRHFSRRAKKSKKCQTWFQKVRPEKLQNEGPQILGVVVPIEEFFPRILLRMSAVSNSQAKSEKKATKVFWRVGKVTKGDTGKGTGKRSVMTLTTRHDNCRQFCDTSQGWLHRFAVENEGKFLKGKGVGRVGGWGGDRQRNRQVNEPAFCQNDPGAKYPLPSPQLVVVL